MCVLRDLDGGGELNGADTSLYWALSGFSLFDGARELKNKLALESSKDKPLRRPLMYLW